MSRCHFIWWHVSIQWYHVHIDFVFILSCPCTSNPKNLEGASISYPPWVFTIQLQSAISSLLEAWFALKSTNLASGWHGISFAISEKEFVLCFEPRAVTNIGPAGFVATGWCCWIMIAGLTWIIRWTWTWIAPAWIIIGAGLFFPPCLATTPHQTHPHTSHIWTHSHKMQMTLSGTRSSEVYLIFAAPIQTLNSNVSTHTCCPKTTSTKMTWGI